MPIFPSNEDADMTPGILGYQCISKFQLVPAGNSQTICKRIERNSTIIIAEQKPKEFAQNRKCSKQKYTTIGKKAEIGISPTSPEIVSQQMVRLSLAQVSK